MSHLGSSPPPARSWRCSSAGLLAPLRDWLGSANVALVLALVVVGAAVFGGRVAGGVTSIAAALSFDYFHTQPYYSLRINDREDIIAAVLLLVMGVAVGQLAMMRYGSRHELQVHAKGAAHLEDVAAVVAAGANLDEVWPVVRRALVDQLELAEARFEPAPFHDQYTPLGRDGQIAATTLHLRARRFHPAGGGRRRAGRRRRAPARPSRARPSAPPRHEPGPAAGRRRAGRSARRGRHPYPTPPPVDLKGPVMADLLFVVITIAFFVVCVGYVHVCDRIIGPDPRQPADTDVDGRPDESASSWPRCRARDVRPR